MNRVVDPERFTIEAAQTNWCQIFNDRFDEFLEVLIELFPQLEETLGSVIEIGEDQFCQVLEELGLPTNVAQLRWMTHPDVGLPTRAFRVWRRRSVPFEGETQMDSGDFTATVGPTGAQVLTWGTPLAMVRMSLGAPAQGLVIGCSGGPTIEHWSVMKPVVAGANIVKIGAGNLTGVILPPGATLNGIWGVDGTTAANSRDWELIEIVGLPVEPGEWAGVGQHDQEQGLLSEGLVAPRDAALARYLRGRAVLGWPAFMAPGIIAPPFTLPDGPLLIDEMDTQILGQIRELADLAPNQQAGVERVFDMPPPEDSTGTQAQTAASEARYSPLQLMLTGAATDPNLSLILGFGTAIAQENESEPFGVVDLLQGIDDFDYMVTADWRRGFDGRSDPVSLAALAIAPGSALAGATPTGVSAVPSMPMAPTEPDGDWRRSVRFLWHRVPQSGFYRVASFAAARVPFVPGGVAELMNEPRDAGGFRPIAASQPPEGTDPEQLSPSGPLPGELTHISAVDRVVNIPAPALPGNNGSITMGYASCTQTIFGLWGSWAGTALALTEPAPNRVPILSAQLRHTATPPGPVPAELVLEFGWDWSVRRPASIVVGGRLYSAAKRSDPPPISTPTLQLPRSLGGADPALEITFSGDVPSGPPGSIIVGLTADGEAFADFGPAQGDDIRRYRITVPGFTLDFSAEPHIGLALWARAVELRAPGRIGPWTEHPFLTAASDPRPPAMPPSPPPDRVQIASLPDASGECHGHLSWPPAASVAGYWIYEATETALRGALGLPPAGQRETLTERLAAIQAAFDSEPVRQPFSRKFSELTQENSLDVTLPKGSRDIHFFVVLSQKLTDLDSAWPAGANASDRLIPIAAPHIARPEPPVLEVRRVLDDSVNPPALRVLITVTPRIGHRARRVVVYRTRVGDAARRVDTMGPPIADLTPGVTGWDIDTASDAFAANHITRAEGFDTPQGSWQRLWYRAEVWSEPNPDRALLAGRSAPSPAQSVVIPPPGPPDLGVIEAEWPGGAAENVLLRWSSRAPLADTPLGPHRMAIDTKAAGTPGLTQPILSEALTLEQIADAPALGTDQWWRSGAPAADGTQAYRARFRRPDLTMGVAASVRVHDPLGRISEALITIPPGPLDPEPTIMNLMALNLPGDRRGVGWTSSVLLAATSGGVYTVRVTAEQTTPPDPGPRPVFRANRSAGTDGQFFRPTASASRLTSPGLRNVERSRLPDLPVASPGGGRRLVVTSPVPDILVRNSPPSEVPSNALALWRAPSLDDNTGFGVATRAEVNRFTVRVTAPDGRFAEATLTI